MSRLAPYYRASMWSTAIDRLHAARRAYVAAHRPRVPSVRFGESAAERAARLDATEAAHAWDCAHLALLDPEWRRCVEITIAARAARKEAA